MSTFAVPITLIKEIKSLPNSDFLEIAKVYDWDIVVRKGQYKVDDRVIYVPVDSVLSQELEQRLFPPDSKIKLNKRRVKSIRIRGQISQGMILNFEEICSFNPGLQGFDLEQDTSSFLFITKYEPPEVELPSLMNVGSTKKKKGNSNFSKYTDIENFKYYDRLFKDGEQVYISEKLHGSSWRAGWFPSEANTIWKKIRKFFKLLPEYEFCWGSRTVQIQIKGKHNGVHIESQGVSFDDIYTKIVKQYSIKENLPYGYAIYGEIVGDGIQKNYTYGCKKNEHKLYVYDIMCYGKWLDYSDFTRVLSIADLCHLKRVPELYVGPFSKEIVDKFRDGDSMIGRQKVREGIVIKPVIETKCSIGRKVLKYISDAYYLRDNTEFH